MKYFVLSGLFMAGAVSVSAQTKVVTNDDLSKYRDARLAAERQLREDYAKLGFPSPEELAKQNAADEKARMDLIHRLQSERLERDRFAAEMQSAEAQLPLVIQPQIIIERQDTGGYLYGYSIYRNRRSPWRSPVRYPFRGNIGWRIAGGMVIYDGGGTNFTVTYTPQRRSVTRLRSNPYPGDRLRRN